MKFNIQRNELIRAINMVVRAVSTKTSMEILKGILFELDNNTLTLTTNNLQMSIQTTLPCQIYETGKFIIDAKMINDIVRKLEEDTIHFSIVETTDLIEVRCKNSKFNIKYVKYEDFPMPSYIDENSFVKIDAQKLKNQILKTGYAISGNNPNPIYQSHFMKIDYGKINMFSIDGFRIVIMDEDYDDMSYDDKRFILQGQSMIEISKIIEDKDEFIKFGYDDRHICFMTENTIITTNLVTGKFLETSDFLPKESDFKSVAKIKLSDFKSAVERVALMSSNKLIKFSTKDFLMNIESRNDAVGDAKEIVDINLEGSDFEIAFNGDFILDAIRYIDEEYININIVDSLSPCVITPENNKNYQNVVLPVRMR